MTTEDKSFQDLLDDLDAQRGLALAAYSRWLDCDQGDWIAEREALQVGIRQLAILIDTAAQARDNLIVKVRVVNLALDARDARLAQEHDTPKKPGAESLT